MAHTMKRGDTRPVFEAQLLGPPATGFPNGVPADLTDSDTIDLIMVQTVPSVGTPVRFPCGVVGDPVEGNVAYIWQAGDTDDVGEFNGEVEVTYADGGVQTFPNDELAPFFEFKFIQDLD